MIQLNHPFWTVAEAAHKLVLAGADIYQKFTCAACGQRLTMGEKNKFFKTGTCDKCGAVTDIEAAGCNYLVHIQTGLAGGQASDEVAGELKAAGVVEEVPSPVEGVNVFRFKP